MHIRMKKNESLLSLPLFFLWPLGGFLLSLRNIASKYSAVVIVLFCTIFGYAFAFENTSADSYRIAWVFTKADFSSLSGIYFVYLEGGSPDLYKIFCYGLVKMFTDSPKVLYALFGFVFGIFWYQALKLFSKHTQGKSGLYITILFIVFFTLNPVTNINGVRFNTTVWVFFFFTYKYITTNKKKWFYYLSIVPLIHFSFLIGVAIVVLFRIFQKMFYRNQKVNKMLYYLFIAAFLLSWVMETNVINLDVIGNLIPFKGITKKISMYNSDKMTEIYAQRQAKSLFLKVSGMFSYIIKIYFFLLIIFFWNFFNKLKNVNIIHNKMLAFIMVFASVSFIASSVPSGARFLIIPYIFSIILLLELFLYYPTKKIKKFILALVPTYSFYFLFTVGYLSFTLTSKTLWFGNLLWILMEGIGFEFKLIDIY